MRIWTKTLNFMAPFYGWGSTASRLEPLRGGSLLFTTNNLPSIILLLHYISNISNFLQKFHFPI